MASLLPILETFNAGCVINVTGVKWGLVEIERWPYKATPNMNGGGMILEPDPGSAMASTRLDFAHPIAAPLRIVVRDAGYLFGDDHTLYVTTRQGNAGGTITVRRQPGETTAMSGAYSIAQEQ